MKRITEYRRDDEGQRLGTTEVEEAQMAQQTALWTDTTTYNALGLLTFHRDEHGRWSSIIYNAAGQPIQLNAQVVIAPGDVRDGIRRTVYDDAGRPVLETDPCLDGAAETTGT